MNVSTYVSSGTRRDLALAAKMARSARGLSTSTSSVHYAIPTPSRGSSQEMLGNNPPKKFDDPPRTDVTLVGQDRSFFEITKFGIERSQGVTAVSEFLRRMTVEEFQIKKPILAIPNFVDLSAYSPTGGHRDAAPLARPGQKILMHASNFRPVKRVSDIVRILERVVREVDAVLLMVGEGPERSAAQALARRLGLQDRVRFLGVYENITELVSRADVFLLPSGSVVRPFRPRGPGLRRAGGLGRRRPAEVVKHAETFSSRGRRRRHGARTIEPWTTSTDGRWDRRDAGARRLSSAPTASSPGTAVPGRAEHLAKVGSSWAAPFPPTSVPGRLVNGHGRAILSRPA